MTTDVVEYTTTFTGPGWPEPRVSRGRLRFLARQALTVLLNGAGLTVETQYGDWDGRPASATDPEIITVARRTR